MKRKKFIGILLTAVIALQPMSVFAQESEPVFPDSTVASSSVPEETTGTSQESLSQDTAQESSSEDMAAETVAEDTKQSAVPFAATVQSGTWGDVNWTLDSDGVLTFLNSGTFANTQGSNPVEYPVYSNNWFKYASSIKKVIFTNTVYAAPRSMGLFYNCQNLTEIVGLDKLNTSNVTQMQFMFASCKSLTNFDISKFNTSKVTNMEGMFSNCHSLTDLNLSSFNTTNVTNMYTMFATCSALTSLNVSSFNTSNVTNMRTLFSNCSSLTSIDVSNFNTSNVTDMDFLFNECSSLTSIDLSNFNTAKLTSMTALFQKCSKLETVNISNFDSRGITDLTSGMSGMFGYTRALHTISLGPNFSFIGGASLVDSGLIPSKQWKGKNTGKVFSDSSDFTTNYTGAFTDTYTRGATSFNISYTLNGGENSTGNPTTYVGGVGVANFEKATAPTGYTFEGWYSDSAFTNKVTSISATQTGDVSLFAHYTANVYKITYSYGTGSEPSVANPKTYTYDVGVASFEEATAPTGYSFEGWYSDSAFTNKVTSISATQTGDVSLFAKYLKIIKLSVTTNNPNGGSAFIVSVNGVAQPNTGNLTFLENDVIKISETPSAHFVFTEWQASGITLGSADKTNASITFTLGTSDVALIANFTELPYVITYKSYDLNVIQNHTVNAEAAVPAGNPPYVAGHTFAGWVIEGTNTKWDPNTNMPHKDISLVATYDKYNPTNTNTAGKATSPKTGDTNNLLLLVTIFFIASLSLVTFSLVVFKKNKNK